MTIRALVDTGPLVAIGNRDEQRHRAMLEHLKALQRPLPTCWPVLTEAAYLLRGRPEHVRQLLELTKQGVLEILPLTSADVDGINEILARFADQRFQLADACLMHLAEREGIEHVFTLDVRDFSIYRTPSGKPLSIVGG